MQTNDKNLLVKSLTYSMENINVVRAYSNNYK